MARPPLQTVSRQFALSPWVTTVPSGALMVAHAPDWHTLDSHGSAAAGQSASCVHPPPLLLLLSVVVVVLDEVVEPPLPPCALVVPPPPEPLAPPPPAPLPPFDSAGSSISQSWEHPPSAATIGIRTHSDALHGLADFRFMAFLALGGISNGQ